MVKLCIVGEAWGESEEALRHPFVGVSGIELLRMADDAGLIPLTEYDRAMIQSFWKERNPIWTRLIWQAHPEVYLTNVFNLHPKGNDIDTLCGPKATGAPRYPALRQGKYIRPEFVGELGRLYGELEREKPNLILALGNTPAWALLRNSGISKIRGTVAECTTVRGLKVLPTYHPAAVLRQYELRHVTVLDLMKAKREMEYPDVRRPERTVYIDPTLDDLEWFWREHVAGAVRLGVDIETAAGEITCIGFATSRAIALVVPFVDARRNGHSYWPTHSEEIAAWAFVRRVLSSPTPKVFQNGLYDIHFLWRRYGIEVANCAEDTMLLHHSLQPESQKGLGFLGSVYTNEASWKIMRDKTGTLKREE